MTNMALNLLELGIPYIKTKISIYLEQRRMNSMDSSRKLNRIEKQSKLQQYESPLDDYMECVINFGFVVLFSSSFMLCPLLCIVLLLVEIKVDAWKLTNLT